MMIYKHDLYNLPTKITFFFSLIYLFNVLFYKRVMSYFAKPNFIVYDEWFDNDFQKTKINFKNKKITNISNIHEFFYEQSNYKVGASENNLQIDINENREKLFKTIILKTILKNMIHYQIKNFYSLEKLPKTNLTLISKIK